MIVQAVYIGGLHLIVLPKGSQLCSVKARFSLSTLNIIFALTTTFCRGKSGNRHCPGLGSLLRELSVLLRGLSVFFQFFKFLCRLVELEVS